jgi:hypothetical protein
MIFFLKTKTPRLCASAVRFAFFAVPWCTLVLAFPGVQLQLQ